MRSWRRLPFLARMASRYARRHRGQTARAITGLVVVALVLTTGMGLGDSISQSLDVSLRARYGPVDIILRAPGPIDAKTVDDVPTLPGVRDFDVRGGSTFLITGAISNARTEQAEAFAIIRGVGPDERQALGPLPSGAEDPRAGEVVLARSLANRLKAEVGDALVLRMPRPGLNETVDQQVVNWTGHAGLPNSGSSLVVQRPALGLAAAARWETPVGTLTLTARAPNGTTFSASASTSPVALAVPGPLATGTWTLAITGDLPVPFTANARFFFAPDLLVDGIGVHNATVAAIVPDVGRAAISFRPVALVPLEDVRRALGSPGKATHGYYATDDEPYAVARAIQEALGNATLDVSAAQEESIRRAKEASRNITGFLLSMSGFTIVAAMLLAYALFSALVEERRTELGIARALGLTRREVALTMVFEGVLYAALAALVGILLGLALLWGIVHGINLVSQGEGGPPFDMYVAPETLPLAFAGGVLLPLTTIAVGAARFANLDPARAIRGAPDDVRVRRRASLTAGFLLLAAGAAGALAPLLHLVSVAVAAAGLAVILAALGYRRWAAISALAGVVYTATSLYTFDGFPTQADELDPILTMSRGLVLSLTLAALAVSSPAPFRWIAKWGAPLRRLARPLYLASRYLTGRRRTAALTAAMIAVVSVVVTVMGTFAALWSNSIPDEEGGYQVIGQTPLPMADFPTPLPQSAHEAIERADFVATHRELQRPNITMEGKPLEGSRWWWRDYASAPRGFADTNEFRITLRADRYGSDRAVWDAVHRGEALVAPTWMFGDGFLESGKTVTIDSLLGPPVSYLVGGAIRGSMGDYIFVSPENLQAMGFPQGALVYVRVRSGADPDTLAHSLTDEYAPHGLVFESVPEEARRAAALLQASILVFESFLALGVFVGIAATGFLASRAVKERLRDIGTLRALGYEAPDVRRAFIAESLLVVFVGLVVGIGVGLVVAHSVWWREIQAEGVDFILPWPLMTGFALLVLVLAGVSARGPARRAAALDPAASLRHVE